MPTRRLAIIWTNDGLCYRRMYASLGPNELIMSQCVEIKYIKHFQTHSAMVNSRHEYFDVLLLLIIDESQLRVIHPAMIILLRPSLFWTEKRNKTKQKQSKVKQSKAQQNKARQSKTKQNKTNTIHHADIVYRKHITLHVPVHSNLRLFHTAALISYQTLLKVF